MLNPVTFPCSIQACKAGATCGEITVTLASALNSASIFRQATSPPRRQNRFIGQIQKQRKIAHSTSYGCPSLTGTHATKNGARKASNNQNEIKSVQISPINQWIRLILNKLIELLIRTSFTHRHAILLHHSVTQLHYLHLFNTSPFWRS